MTPRRRPWLVLLAAALAFAGCSTPAADVDVPGDVADEAAGDPGALIEETPADDTGGDRWYGFAFDETVTPKSGAPGKVQAYSARLTQEEDGKATTFDLAVEVLGTSTMDIRTKRVSFTESYEMKEEIITTPLEVTEFKHTVTIVEDATGEHQAGDVAVIHGFTPTDETKEAGTWLFGFARMAWTTEDGTASVIEYYAPPQSMADGETLLPYQEGDEDFSSHWGHTLFTYAFNPMWLTGWADGSQEFEEGTWSFGGHSYETVRKTLTVSDYTFDGWHVEWTASSGGTTATWMFEVAPALPLPFAYRFGGTSSGSEGADMWTYELRGLTLG